MNDAMSLKDLITTLEKMESLGSNAAVKALESDGYGGARNVKRVDYIDGKAVVIFETYDEARGEEA